MMRTTVGEPRRWFDDADRHPGAERAHSWMNRFRRILIRWEKKPANYLAMLHFALGIIA
jgi:hypothetical protein